MKAPFCPDCGKIQAPLPVGEQDHFAAIGVARRWDLDREIVDARYRELQRALHPDRFAKASPRERMLSVQQATNLNEAYRVLKDPVRRAEYLVRLAGVDLDDEKAGGDRVAPELLVEVMELREGLLEAKSEGDAAKVESMRKEVEARRAAALARVGEELRGAGDGLPTGERARAVAAGLVAMRYYKRFLDEAEGQSAEM